MYVVQTMVVGIWPVSFEISIEKSYYWRVIVNFRGEIGEYVHTYVRTYWNDEVSLSFRNLISDADKSGEYGTVVIGERFHACEQ